MTIKQSEQKEITKVLQELEGKTEMDNIVGNLVGKLGKNKSMELFDLLGTNRETLRDTMINGERYGWKDDNEKTVCQYETENHPKELEDSLDKIITYLY